METLVPAVGLWRNTFDISDEDVLTIWENRYAAERDES